MGRAQAASHLPRPRDDGPRPPVYTALPFTNVTIPGVLLPAFGVVAMLLTVENRGSLPPGSRYTFHIQQRIGGRVVGGCP